MFRNYDAWKADDAPDPGRVEDVEGCADCGDLICTCAERCSACWQRFRTEPEAEVGLCGECQVDAAEAAAADWAFERGRL